MFSRHIIWLLLVLVPFQSFAAVGVIQCTDAWSTVGHAHHVARQLTMPMDRQMATSTDTHTVRSLAMPTTHYMGHSAPARSMVDSSHHHSHKSPCCCDNPVMFFPTAPLVMQLERLIAIVNPERHQLKSVYLDGPKRPPRLTFS
jgi:hypothetical protein